MAVCNLVSPFFATPTGTPGTQRKGLLKRCLRPGLIGNMSKTVSGAATPNSDTVMLMKELRAIRKQSTANQDATDRQNEERKQAALAETRRIDAKFAVAEEKDKRGRMDVLEQIKGNDAAMLRVIQGSAQDTAMTVTQFDDAHAGLQAASRMLKSTGMLVEKCNNPLLFC
jgi:hypothetical protein